MNSETAFQNVKRMATSISLVMLLVACGGGSSETNELSDQDNNGNTSESAQNDNTESQEGDSEESTADPSPASVVLSASPMTINSGSSTEITWSVSDADNCEASGAWTGNKNTSGTEEIFDVSEASDFTLDCSGEGGSDSATVSVSVVAADSSAAVGGAVDSSRIDRFGENRIYVYLGHVTPGDFGGSGAQPIASVMVEQDENQCTWAYQSDTLASGEYTLAFTNEAELDQAGQADIINFSHVTQLSIDDSALIATIPAEHIVRIGPTREYQSAAQAYASIQSGDVVEFDAGTYIDDVVVWRQDNLTLRGVMGRAHIQGNRVIPHESGSDANNGKGLWVVRGDNVKIENMQFSQAQVEDENGAGIRLEGDDISICNSYFHDNENGILGTADKLLIEYSEFDHNGFGYGQTHNLYISDANHFIFQFNYSHHAHIGHNLKSRAEINDILYNRIMDEESGDSSYAIDLPNGGNSLLLGNTIQQGADTDNSTMVRYGAEGLSNASSQLKMVNNTLVNDRHTGNFVSLASGTNFTSINDAYVGNGTTVYGAESSETAIENSFVSGSDPGFVNKAEFNYRLSSAATGLINQGKADQDTAQFQYQHPVNRANRTLTGSVDIGAFEYRPLDTLEAGFWMEIPNSHLRDVAPDPLPMGNSGLRSVTSAWSGGAYDSKRNQMIIWGGGHADYSGNEVYTFDLDSLEWSRPWGPSAPEDLPTGDAFETYLDGAPSSRHTYMGLTYLPDPFDKMWSQGGSRWQNGYGTLALWEFDLGSHTWEQKTDAPDSHLGVVADYDPVSGKVIHRSNYSMQHYDPSNDEWETTHSNNGGWWNDGNVGLVIPSRRIMYITGQGRSEIYHIENHSYSYITTTGDNEIEQTTAPGITYDPIGEKVIAWTAGSEVFELDLDTLVWTKIEANPDNNVSPLPSNRTYGRFRYAASLDAFVLVNGVDENVYLYRVERE